MYLVLFRYFLKDFDVTSMFLYSLLIRIDSFWRSDSALQTDFYFKSPAPKARVVLFFDRRILKSPPSACVCASLKVLCKRALGPQNKPEGPPPGWVRCGSEEEQAGKRVPESSPASALKRTPSLRAAFMFPRGVTCDSGKTK